MMHITLKPVNSQLSLSLPTAIDGEKETWLPRESQLSALQLCNNEDHYLRACQVVGRGLLMHYCYDSSLHYAINLKPPQA